MRTRIAAAFLGLLSPLIFCHDGSAIWEGLVVGNWNLVVDGEVVAGAMFDDRHHLVVREVPEGSKVEFVDVHLDLQLRSTSVVAWEATAPDCADETGDTHRHVEVGGARTLSETAWPMRWSSVRQFPV